MQQWIFAVEELGGRSRMIRKAKPLEKYELNVTTHLYPCTIDPDSQASAAVFWEQELQVINFIPWHSVSIIGIMGNEVHKVYWKMFNEVLVKHITFQVCRRTVEYRCSQKCGADAPLFISFFDVIRYHVGHYQHQRDLDTTCCCCICFLEDLLGE